MFENHYPVNKVGFSNAYNKKYLISLTTYSFKTPKNHYIVEVEHYKHDIYIIKFCLKRLKENKKKFNLLSNEFCCSRIVGTCVQIILSIFKKNKKASFGFLGSYTVDFKNNYIEPKECTKRFRIYKYAIECIIGDQYFTHFMDETNSTYLIVNNSVASVDELQEQANSMFTDLFPELSGL